MPLNPPPADPGGQNPALISGQELLGESRTLSAEVHEVITDKHPVWPRIPVDMIDVWRAVSVAMERVELPPLPWKITWSIYVIATGHAVTAVQVRLLLFEPEIAPILGNRNNFSHAHGMNKMAATPDAATIAARPDHPVIDRSMPANVWLASGKSTVAPKGVGGKAAVVADDVGVQRHAGSFPLNKGAAE